MRSDTKALLKVLAWSGVVALVAIGVGVAAAVGWLTKEAAAVVVLGVIVVGGLVIGRKLGRALTGRRVDPGDGDASESRARSGAE